MSETDGTVVAHYWKKRVVEGPITVEYSSEDDEVIIVYKRTHRGQLVRTEFMRIDETQASRLSKILADISEESTE